jgi:hypothetical protein
MYGHNEQDISFPTPIPVNITYQTAFVDESGKLQFLSDVYNLDSRMISAIKHERGMVEMAQERPQEGTGRSSSRRARVPDRRAAVATNNSNPTFFESLFGGGNTNTTSARPVPPRRVR